jgi:hypothetical protein
VNISQITSAGSRSKLAQVRLFSGLGPFFFFLVIARPTPTGVDLLAQ